MNQDDFTKIRHDVNGNPRYVCHYLHLNTDYEKSQAFWDAHGLRTVSEQYRRAAKRANKIGGRKYHAKTYGGGIVFQSYNLGDTIKAIQDIVNKESNNEVHI